MKNKFDVYEYVEKNFSEEVLKNYEEDFGLNGMDSLWECEDEVEVNEKLEGYVNYEEFESYEIMERINKDVSKLFEILNDSGKSEFEKGSIENWIENMKENLGRGI